MTGYHIGRFEGNSRPTI